MVTTVAVNTKVTEIENKIPEISHFITAQELKRLTKINLDARKKEADTSLARKSKIYNALDLVDKNRKKNFKHLIQVISLVKVILKMAGPKII